jgi:hypothetical protein
MRPLLLRFPATAEERSEMLPPALAAEQQGLADSTVATGTIPAAAGAVKTLLAAGPFAVDTWQPLG